MLILPRIGSKGFYDAGELDYGIKSKVLYTLLSIESFSSLLSKGVDVFNDYYVKVGLDQAKYQEDLAAGASILTIDSPVADTIALPNSVLTGYPIANTIDYSRVVVSAELGLLPDSLDMAVVTQEVQTQIESILGVSDITMRVHRIELDEAVDIEEHKTREAARLLALDENQSVFTKLATANTEIDKLREKVALLERYIREQS